MELYFDNVQILTSLLRNKYVALKKGVGGRGVWGDGSWNRVCGNPFRYQDLYQLQTWTSHACL